MVSFLYKNHQQMSSHTNHQSNRSLTKAEEEEIQHAFELFDAEGKGVISAKSLREAMECQDPSKVKHILDSLPPDGGTLTLDDFTAILTRRRDEKPAHDFERVFQLFDVDQKGYITLQDLKRVSNELGETMTDDELQEMIDRAGLRNNGKVSLEEFRTMMTRNLFA